jgi:acyl-homoserine lactone acylase PvdQ
VVTKNSGLKPLTPAPYYLSYAVKADAGEDSLNTRGERLFQVLAGDRKFTLEEMTELGFDTYIMAADAIVPLLHEASVTRAKDGPVARAAETLQSWNRRSAEDSVATTYLFYWAKAYEELFTAAKFSRFNAYDRAKIDIHSTEEQDRAWRALEEAVEHIEKRFGKAEVPWGQINVVVRGGKFPMDGIGEIFNPLHPDEGPAQENGQMYCNDGWGHLLIVMEGNPKQVWSLLPYGQSEHVSSPHYNDQAKLHSERKAKRFWLTPTEILEHSESVWGDKGRLQRLAHQ